MLSINFLSMGKINCFLIIYNFGSGRCAEDDDVDSVDIFVGFLFICAMDGLEFGLICPLINYIRLITHSLRGVKFLRSNIRRIDGGAGS